MNGRACLLLSLVALAGCHSNRPSQPPYASASAPPPPPTRRPAAIPDEPVGPPVSTEIGIASWYGPPYHNRQAADGSVFDQNALTAAHRTLPLGTFVRVTNLASGQQVVVKITDRGPFVAGRSLDLSLGAARAIGIERLGVARVRIEAFANPTADPAGRWCVQIGVFIDPADAVQFKNDLAHRYKTARVIEFAGPTGHWVRITPTPADQATAAAIAAAIHLPDAEPFLVRLN
jgi:rare lipoprotein A